MARSSEEVINMKSSAKKPAMAKTKTDTVALLVATKKGGFILSSDNKRRRWDIKGPIFLGNIVHHMALDPRDMGEGRVMLMAAKTGHLGPTVFRSKDFGKTWKEASKPPAFVKAPEGEKGRVVDHVFWLTPGLASEPGVWYAGTSPQGLFRSEDGGDAWESVIGFNDHPMREKWTGGAQDGTPDGPKMHSINVDPRDPNHIYIGKSSGDIGFPMVLHPRDPNTVWVFPMDGTMVWPRTSPGGKPAAYVTHNSGKTWKRQDEGLPSEHAWFTVFRQAMTADTRDPVGIYFGTTCGEVWAGANEGEKWNCIARHLPHIYAVEAAEL